MIEFRGVNKWFGDLHVLKDINLTIRRGEVVVIAGPSGSGKSTLLRTINYLEPVQEGEILVDGQPIGRRRQGNRWVEESAAELNRKRQEIGMVFQQYNLFPHMTALENVMEAPVRVKKEPKDAVRERARALLERVGLADKMHSYPAQLSGGQQQRVGVARALAADPPVLLMDEPFSAVDPVVRKGLQDELLRLQDELGKTVVFVTHDIDEAIKLGTMVAVLREGGRLAQYAPPAELLSNPADAFVEDFLGADRGIRRSPQRETG